MFAVVRRRGLTGLVVLVVALLVVVGAPAAPKPVPGETDALTAVRKAVAKHWLDAASATADRNEIARAAHLARVLAPDRRIYLENALEQVGALAGRLTAPRAVAVFGQLRANDDWFAQHAAPSGGEDITDSDGIVYRFFSGQCFEFHPLANFGALNARVAAKDVAGTQRLADALAARGVHLAGGGIAWEYYFRFEGARPAWTSGMAQAVAAQAFARAALLVTGETATLDAEARGAYLAIPGRLTTNVSAGPWIRLYSAKTVQVLNAQLQSILSLQSYAKNTDDTSASTLATQMQDAAAATLPQFDTGYWMDYSLAGAPSPLSYYNFVLQLLQKLAPADSRFAVARAHFEPYLHQAPAFQVANAPVDAVRFWLSKPAWVSVASSGSTLQLGLDAGWHTLHLGEPKSAGIYVVKVTATDPAGNHASFTALPLVRVAAVAGKRAPQTLRTTAGTAASTPPAFVVGAGLDSAAQAPQALSLGLGLVRLTVPWQPGETSADPATAASLQSLPASAGLVLEVEADQLPTDDAGRAALAEYAASLAQQAPTLRDLVLTPAPALATAPVYADALAAIRTAVEAAKPGVAVGPSFDGSTPTPQQTAVALAGELSHDGAKADVVAFRPAPVPGIGAWATPNVSLLRSVFAKSLGAAPPVLLDGIATPTTVPASELGAYTGGAPPTGGAVTPTAQAASYTAAIGSASCAAGVVGLLLDRLDDEGATPAPATGLYYAGGDAKPSASAVEQEVAAVGRGAVVCPGLAAPVKATALTFPTQLGGSTQPAVTLGCSRDCLYLVALVRGDGRPIVAVRGSLAGGRAAQSIALPVRRLARGTYRVDVRLVSRVDPGAVTRRMSGVLTVG